MTLSALMTRAIVNKVPTTATITAGHSPFVIPRRNRASPVQPAMFRMAPTAGNNNLQLILSNRMPFSVRPPKGGRHCVSLRIFNR